MDRKIEITAEPGANPATCKFTVDAEVAAGDAAYFPDAKRAEGSPLAEGLFAIENVTNVLIADKVITVTKSGAEEWPVIGKQIGAAIRGHLASGQPAISPDFQAGLPDEDAVRTGVQRILDTEINPMVANHGGMISLIDVQGRNVYLKLGGGCQGCGQADVTLKLGVERAIRAAMPEVGEILDTTDHAAGRNPYYEPSMK